MLAQQKHIYIREWLWMTEDEEKEISQNIKQKDKNVKI